MTSAGTSHVPLGEGLVMRRLRLADESIVHLRGILVGYDGLASAHGDREGRGVVVLITTTEREAELDAWIDDVSEEIPLERL